MAKLEWELEKPYSDKSSASMVTHFGRNQQHKAVLRRVINVGWYLLIDGKLANVCKHVGRLKEQVQTFHDALINGSDYDARRRAAKPFSARAIEHFAKTGEL